MAVSFLLTTFALICLHTSAAGAEEPKIQGGNPRYATVGSCITFTCVLYGNLTGGDTLVRWIYNNQKLTSCGCDEDKKLTDLILGNDTYKACSLTIDPVTESSGGLYECKAHSVGLGVNAAVQLVINGRDSKLYLLDPSTGAVLDDPEYGPVCVQSGTTRQFECRIQDARPGVWNFTWMLGNQTITSKRRTRTGAGQVNVSRSHIVTNPGNETRERNLTCLATSSDLSLNATVLITFCAESEYAKTVLRVLVSICVTATIATIITHILLCKHYGYI
ncbi:uncharacterized protein LOC119732128 [Patiria miniata]|uniref:Ig-like domain-containing protein n=1 Tax=Patiria miniata TaxID=46514 RepID=A0A914AC11_PATMI|nr:uncharacterized protein LOC119732128 [Patiria miniata]